MDILMNVLLNVFEFLGIEHANQIIIFIMIMALGVMYKLADMARWVVGVFLAIMAVSLVTAVYQITYNARAQCIYAYDETKPVIADSSERLLVWDEIREMNCPSLWVARNEIFYRDGYCFFTPIGYAYFESNGRKCNPAVEAATSEIGNKNTRTLGRLERRKGCQSPPKSCRNFSRVPSSKLIINRAPLKSQ